MYRYICCITLHSIIIILRWGPPSPTLDLPPVHISPWAFVSFTAGGVRSRRPNHSRQAHCSRLGFGLMPLTLPALAHPFIAGAIR